MDHDGALDLLVRSATEARLTVLRNQQGGFPASGQVSIPLAVAATALASGDLDGDGAPDVILAGSDGTVRVLWNDGTGTLAAAGDKGLAVAPGLTALAVGDA